MKNIRGIRKLLLALCLMTTVMPLALTTRIQCKYDEFKVQDVVGNLSCVSCKKCPAGLGLSPQCGSYIPYGIRIECKPCVSGVTYSSTNSIESCQPCGICQDHQKVLQKCNKTQNSICAKNCDVGFYLSSLVGDCQECSWCCPDSGPSEHEPQCKKDGVPFYKRCSVGESIPCSPKCTNKQYVIVTKALVQSCHDCPHCGIGKGLYPKCESVLTSMKESKCQTCIPAKTYSDSTDSSSCKQCKVCGVGKKIERSCNITHDTLCGDCDHGFYNASQGDDNEINCQHCSYCCGDEEDVIIPECKAQGMPKNMQCAYTTRVLTRCAPAASGNKTLWIISGIMGFLVVIMIFCLICGYRYMKNRNTTAYQEMNTVEPTDPMQVLLEKELPSCASISTNIEFQHSGITVQCPDAQTGEVLLKEMSVEICWEMHKYLPYQRGMIHLSPVIQFHLNQRELETAVTLDIPHSAYLQEENNTWNIKVLKASSESLSELTELSDDAEIKVNPCSVSFKVKDLPVYCVVVGEASDSKRAKKRMQCAVFGATPIPGQTYSTRIYIFDDAESSLKKLRQQEENKGCHLLQHLFHTLHPDVDNKSVIDVAIENVKIGWKGELFNNQIKCSEWIDSFKTIPKIEAHFKHIDPEVRDFHCLFKLKFEDKVVEIPVFHFAEGMDIKTGIQPSDDQHAPTDDTTIGIIECQTPMKVLRCLSSVSTDVLKTFYNSLEQSIGEDHTRIESVASKIIPSITAEEVATISMSDHPFQILIETASNREKDLKVVDVKHALEEVGLNSKVLLPYLYEEHSTEVV